MRSPPPGRARPPIGRVPARTPARTAARGTLAAILAAQLLAAPAFAQAPATGKAGVSAAGKAGGAATAGGTAAPLSAEEQQELTELETLGTQYESASREHHRRLLGILKGEYDGRIRSLEDRYAKRIEGATKDYRARHLSALAELERFLQRYPDDQKWTPSVMFRLAELYLDQAGFEYEETQAAASAELGLGYNGPDYTKALNLWRDIVRRFPEFRQIDGTLYLLAYYLGEMGQFAEAKQAYLGLVCHAKFDALAAPPPVEDPDDVRARIGRGDRPPPVDPKLYDDCTPRRESVIVDEAWVRLGEIHFDTRGELALAIAAYQRVATKKDSEFYDEALYKLAWSYYRNDQFLEGINAFDELIVYSDKQEEEGNSSVELRQEAVDYVAISFSDPWEKDAQPDPVKSLERIEAYYKGREKEKHVRDIYEKLGDNLRAGEAYDPAIASWRWTLDRHPLHPRNPIVHQKIVDALTDKGDQMAAAEERRKLAALYRKGSAWYAANETNREAMDNAQKLGEASLLASAKQTHRAAQLAKKEWESVQVPEAKTRYLELYRAAAGLYQQYLLEFPSSSEVYELTYRLADCYFFSEQYEESVPHYRWVRDHRDLGTKYFEPAALSIVQAYQAAIDQQKASGKLTEPPIPTKESLAQAGQPLAIPAPYRNLQQAYDEYMQLVNDQQTAPKMALASAMISYRHRQLGDALPRFERVMQRYCKTPEAVQAKDGILVIYQAKGEDRRFQATIDKFVKQGCGDDSDVAVAKAQKLSMEYEIAAKAYSDGKFDEAAAKFYALYKTAPAKDPNRDDSLFSAAISFEKAGKPKTAIAIYQELSKDPQFKGSEFYVESLYRTAVSYQNAFDYDTAVDTYLAVAAAAAEPGRKSRQEFDLGQARLDSMWNAAVLREQDRVYYDRGKNDPGAVTLYQRYAALEKKDRKRASEALFRAGLVYEKANDTKNMIKAFAAWKKTYGGDEGSGGYAVLSQYKTAKALEKKRDKKGADAYYRATIKAFDQSGEKVGSPAAELAGEAQFWLAEDFYRASFEDYKVKWKGSMTGKNGERNVNATLNELESKARACAQAYNSVIRFESSWSLATAVRLGDVSFFAGQKLIEAPIPKDIEKLDRKNPEAGVLGEYQSLIEQRVQPQTDQAKELWVKALASAKRQGVANAWSKLAQQRLNAFIAADLYPVQRDELIEREDRP